MWLSRRTLLLGLGLSALASCGFEPVYGTNGSASALRGAVLVDDPKDRQQFQLTEQLEARLGRATAARYGLKVDLSVQEEGLAISGSNDITRYNVLGVADFVLRDLATGQPVMSDKVNTFTSYSASAQPVATLAAERDATQRLMTALADKIVTQLLLNAGNL
ncbi:LPS assembly lipoprotein LptE [uncultured Litoreibacter sp.]|uniref:LPS assembly lipoprotein LptE n=1 Tax=uncultured Litoreibacter sp. TaxID=1392394 RepID=UPI002627A05A|nr:LPS assembly lipoprotein LptE [uncultured Litoreibacter sp.]